MNKILILDHGESDLASLISVNCENTERFNFEEYGSIDFEAYDAYAFLGGNCEEAFMLPPPLRVKFEALRKTGKPIFAEFIRSVGYHSSGNVLKMDHQRLMYREQPISIGGLSFGDILDGHYNDCCRYDFLTGDIEPILSYYDYLNAHAHIDAKTYRLDKGIPALWLLDGNTLISSFRLCNFNRARFAPENNWKCVLRYILTFLAGENIAPTFPAPVCRFEKDTVIESPSDASEVVRMGLDWFENANMLIDSGKLGVKEGFSHHISAKDGKQKCEALVRTDCSGETGGAFMMDWLLTSNEKSKRIFENIESFCFEYMQEKSGAHKGMLRWTENAWGTCYQDDVARAILPTLLCQNYTESGSRYFGSAVDALRYLLRTTGPSGLRTSCTVASFMDEESEKRYRETDYRITTKAHHNSFYQAALLLAYRAGAPKEFLEVGVKGLSSVMTLYPENERETSETEEMCRLIFPLSVLYQVTGEEEHRKWLYRVANDLERVQHESGGFCEWDTGYKASCSRRENGECALLAENGDPVIDLLYSNNWLPLGFAYAYMVTNDRYFYEKWLDVTRFLARCQVHSNDISLHGSWSRGFDVERWEIYGVPHDIGWSPCCVETGWTVGEILMGIQFMIWLEKRENAFPVIP
ncbi:MAG: hypothetical protein IJX27_09810 [Clostridia bacterium]|nr:hypothetical protein [Clostridia bacterium]